MSALIAMNAAKTAYKKVRNQTKVAIAQSSSLPSWMNAVSDRLQEDHGRRADVKVILTSSEQKEQNHKHSPNPYERLAWLCYKHITSTTWFETYILVCIIMIGVSTGVELEVGEDAAPWVVTMGNIVSSVTFVSFTAEVVLKIVAEGLRPMRYFTDPDDGGFNTFDFFIVTAGFVFLGNSGGSAIVVLRMLRLVRLFTFIKGVPQLRVIISGLLHGIRSVTFIVMLLFLIIYLFSIMGCLFLGENDPARFGTVPVAMLSLFQVSTLASWTSIAYTSWYGCENYIGAPYAGSFLTDSEYEAPAAEGGRWSAESKGRWLWGHPSVVHESIVPTTAGDFQGFRCYKEKPAPALTFLFFSIYIVLTSWVIMSLFIGVISMGMFEAYEIAKTEKTNDRYRQKLLENSSIFKRERDANKSKNSKKTSSESEEKDPESGGDKGADVIDETRFDKFGGGLSMMQFRMDCALGDEVAYVPPDSQIELLLQDIFDRSKTISESNALTQVVTLTIIAVGVMIGMETDQLMHCNRREGRKDSQPWRNASYWEDQDSWCDDGVLQPTMIVAVVSQTVFTVEAVIKILAEGWEPLRYFDDAWNKLDFFIVCVGFAEMTPASFIFDLFPVVVLRLLRLLRVFRLAKALPRLRSIVEALISGFSAVGWICVLIVIFNYITACLLMLILQEADPFHWGSVGKAMFNVLRVETLDTWDHIMRIAVLGCDETTYEFLRGNNGLKCEKPLALGWIGAFLFFFIVIFGSYVLPTVLIGIVSISFEDASRKSTMALAIHKDVMNVVTKAKKDMPKFMTPGRLRLIHALFQELDADSEMTLDFNEVYVLMQYSMAVLFEIDTSREECEAMFHLLDIDGDTDVSEGELVCFIVAMKHIEKRCIDDPFYAKQMFPNGIGRHVTEEGEIVTFGDKRAIAQQDLAEHAHNPESPSNPRKSFGQGDTDDPKAKAGVSEFKPGPYGTFKASHRRLCFMKAIATLDKEAMVEAWDSILKYISEREEEALKKGRRLDDENWDNADHLEGLSPRLKQQAKQQSFSSKLTKRELLTEVVQDLFNVMDSDGEGELDTAEFARGLVALGIELGPRQISALVPELDKSGDGLIDFKEFADRVLVERTSRQIALDKASVSLGKKDSPGDFDDGKVKNKGSDTMRPKNDNGSYCTQRQRTNTPPRRPGKNPKDDQQQQQQVVQLQRRVAELEALVAKANVNVRGANNATAEAIVPRTPPKKHRNEHNDESGDASMFVDEVVDLCAARVSKRLLLGAQFESSYFAAKKFRETTTHFSNRIKVEVLMLRAQGKIDAQRLGSFQDDEAMIMQISQPEVTDHMLAFSPPPAPSRSLSSSRARPRSVPPPSSLSSRASTPRNAAGSRRLENPISERRFMPRREEGGGEHDAHPQAQVCGCGNIFEHDRCYCCRCGARRPQPPPTATGTSELALREACREAHERCFCGSKFKRDAIFCRRCGSTRGPAPHQPPSTSRQCFCGHVFRGDAQQFCRQCGSARASSPGGANGARAAAQPHWRAAGRPSSLTQCLCGQAHHGDAAFCSRCGTKKPLRPASTSFVATWGHCSCGKKFAADSIFCNRCGEKRPQQTPTEAQCGCGNVFLKNSLFCRRCGSQRPVKTSSPPGRRSNRSEGHTRSGIEDLGTYDDFEDEDDNNNVRYDDEDEYCEGEEDKADVRRLDNIEEDFVDFEALECAFEQDGEGPEESVNDDEFDELENLNNEGFDTLEGEFANFEDDDQEGDINRGFGASTHGSNSTAGSSVSQDDGEGPSAIQSQGRLSSRIRVENSVRSVMHTQDPRRSSRRGESVDRPENHAESGIRI